MSHGYLSRVTASRSWRQRVAIALATATLFGTGKLMGTAMAVIIGRRGTPFAVSMVLTAYFLGKMVFAPAWGAVADITGKRRTVLVGTSLLGVLAILPLAVAGGTWLPIGFRGLYAVFAAAFAPIMLTIVSVRGGEEGRGESVGFFNSAAAVGTTGAQLAAGVLLGLLVPSKLFLVIAGLALVTTIVVIFIKDPTPTPERTPTLREVWSEVRRRLVPATGDRAHLTTNGLQWLYVGIALRNVTVLSVMSLMPVFLIERVGLSEFLMGALLAINPGTQSLFMYVFGRMTDEIGRKQFITLGIGGSGVFAVLTAAAPLPSASNLRILLAGSALFIVAVTFSAMRTGAIAFIGDVSPDERESELMGLLTTAKGAGAVVGPPLFGLLATVTTYQFTFVSASLLAFSGSALVAITLTEPQ